MFKDAKLIESAKHLFRQFMKFGAIGVLNTALFYALYLVLLTVIKPASAYYLAYVLSMIFAVLANLKFTFEKLATTRKFTMFVGVYLVSMYMGGLVLNMLIGLSIHPSLAGILTIGVTVMTNFLGLKAAAKWA